MICKMDCEECVHHALVCTSCVSVHIQARFARVSICVYILASLVCEHALESFTSNASG